MVLTHLSDCLDDEVGPYSTRPSCQKFEQWILSTGKSIRGSKRKKGKTRRRGAADAEEEDIDFGTSQAPLASPRHKGRNSTVNIFADVFSLLDDAIWPLQLIDKKDKEQFSVLYPLLFKLPHAVMYYLNEIIFPEMLAHQGLKLSTCGQELGGDMIFARRIGFSGTPSDILPLELGSCQYERGSDGKVVHFLTSPDIVEVVHVTSKWNAKSILRQIANVSIFRQ
jgi:hypothetical protein